MDIRQLRYFVTIAEEGTITKAAQHLHMAQPPLSRQLKQMEDELGVTLFERNKKKKVTLTNQGYLFLKKAKEVLHKFDEAIIEVQEFGEEVSGTLSVGSTIYCAPVLLSTLNRFRHQYADIKFNIWEGSSAFLMDLLDNHQIDIAITAGPFSTDNIEIQKLNTDPCVVIVPNDYPVENTSLNLHEIALLPLLLLRPSQGNGLYDEIIVEFQHVNIEANILCECHDSAMLLNLVKMGFGATILPESMVHDQFIDKFKIVHIQNNPWITEPHIVWRANSYLPASAKEFLTFFNES